MVYDKKVVVITNSISGLYSFRVELIDTIIKEGYSVAIATPDGERTHYFRSLGCKIVLAPVNRRGINPLKDILLLVKYIKIMKDIKPDVVFTYTIKPNVFGGIACRITGVPYISNITGLGTSIEGKGLLAKISLLLYKSGLKGASRVFFQNSSIKDFMTGNNIVKEGKAKIIPGSGVNTDHHNFEKYPEDDGRLRFFFAGRIMKEKGVFEYLEAAKKIRDRYPYTEFHVAGRAEKKYENILKPYIENKTVIYDGVLSKEDMHKLYKQSHAIVIPSYHEGICNVLLEAASTGRPLLASKVPGCIETFDEGVSGLGFRVKSVESLVDTIIKFINIPYDKKREMGLEGRKKMEREFNRKVVVDAYMEEVKKILQFKNKDLKDGE